MKTFLISLILLYYPLYPEAQTLGFSEPSGAQLSYDLKSYPKDDPTLFSSEKVYFFNRSVDLPIIGVGAAWSLYAFSKIYDKPHSSEEEILNLRGNQVNRFDRWAAGNNSDNASNNSDFLFYGSIPLPFLLFTDKKIRQDAARISVLYLEAMSITGFFYTGSAYFTDRYRPEAYDANISVSDRTDGNYRNSFLAGHTALVATSTFFTAKVFSDYHPDSKLKWVLYGGAIAATGTMMYLRHQAGKHFPSDQIAGVTLGVLSGILVPHLHKNKPAKENRLLFTPQWNNQTIGFNVHYRF